MNNLSARDLEILRQGGDPFGDGGARPFHNTSISVGEAERRANMFMPSLSSNQDYVDEFDRIMENGNDPLLMYILQKNAQEGFKHGPIGTDGYYEQFDPALNPDLEEEYRQFLETNYR